ncbi:MAG: DUF222 domain-containing protein, partial [Galactobacter sp.]
RSGGHTTSGDQKPQQQGQTRPPAVLVELKGHVALLNAEVFAGWDNAEALAGLAALETVKRMIEARQALITDHIVRARCQAAEAAERSVRNVPAEVGKDLGLARKLNGSRARHLVDLASDCPDQAPHTFRLWADGKVSEEQALTLFRHTTLLTPAGRSEADDTVAEDLPNLGLRELRKRLDGVVAQLEPELVAERRKKAAEQRRAGFTYRPDGMMNLNALLPGVAGQAMETILSTYARSKRHGKDGHDGDERTQDQLKADLLTALVIGWARATKGLPGEFLRAHHIGCGGQPGHPCTQAQAQTDEGNANGNGEDGSGDRGSGGSYHGACSPGGDTSNSTDEQCGDGACNDPSGTDDRADGNAAGESCTPTTGFTDVETIGDLFSHLVPGEASEDEGVAGDVWVPAGMEYDSTLGLLLPAGVGVHVNLVITDLSAFGITDQPAQIFGLGPYPAEMARELIHTAHTRHSATMRRLYTEPGSGALMRMESTARTFPDGLGTMIALRDGHCRFPFCDAPIRHLDHIQPHAEGGATSYGNGQGLCARHNLLKEADGATTEPEHNTSPGPGAGAIITVLSTGMKFTSPTRAFPSESPMSVAEDHYWRGYREGRGDQRQQQTDREHDLQNQEDTIFAAEDHLKQMANALLEHGTAR